MVFDDLASNKILQMALLSGYTWAGLDFVYWAES